MDIFFRCDSTIEIGTGHVFRCLALADSIRKDVGDVVFFCRKDTADLGSIIIDHGYRLVYMPKFTAIDDFDLVRFEGSHKLREFESEDIIFLTDWASKNLNSNHLGSVVLVADHYMLGSWWQGHARRLFGKLVVIDDLLDIAHNSDLIIDPNIRLPLELNDYVESLPDSSDFYSGAEYLFIRESLKGFRQTAVNRMIEGGDIENALVMFGGSDVQNFTMIAIEGCLKVKGLHVHVLLGFNNANRAELVSLFAGNKRVSMHPFLKEPGEIMALCDVCIGALGTITWERCFLGLPSLIHTDQPSQRKFIDYLVSEEIVIDLSSEYSADTVALKLGELRSKIFQYNALRERLFSFVDGNGIKNIKEKICAIK